MEHILSIKAAVIAAGILILLYLTTSVVPAGHVGVKDFFGQVPDRPLHPGINFVVPFTTE